MFAGNSQDARLSFRDLRTLEVLKRPYLIICGPSVFACEKIDSVLLSDERFFFFFVAVVGWGFFRNFVKEILVWAIFIV